MGLGGSPFRRTRAAVPPVRRLAEGTAEMSAHVYGCNGRVNSEMRSDCSTISPRYMTATSSQTYCITPRSWEMNR